MHRKGGGPERHSMLYTKYQAKCWSNSKFLLQIQLKNNL